jgi:hypothetical protein
MIKETRRKVAAVVAALGIGIGGAVWATSAASAAPAATPECTSGQLAVWVSPDLGNGAAGSVGLPLEFTNVSHHACFLIGWPGVSALDSKGRQLGRPAARDSSVRRAAVVVAPGATASALLKWTDVLNFPPAACRPVRAATLRVFAPDQFASRSAYFSLLACSKSGPIYLTISRIRAGLLVP